MARSTNGHQIPFVKAVGSGNDFVIVDRRSGRLPANLGAWAQRLCDRMRGIGADGVMVVEPSRRADLRMRIFNADGSEAEMCGNGARCLALYARASGLAGARMRIETRAGLVDAQVLGRQNVRLAMTPPKHWELNVPLAAQGRRLQVHAITAGVPHAVIFVPNVERVDVEGLGRAIRRHRHFAPAGANVNFVQRKGRCLVVRTYERGVEGETLACGTGAVASALIAWKVHGCSSPITVEPRSGEPLMVSFAMHQRQPAQVTLAGPARLVYRGTLYGS